MAEFQEVMKQYNRMCETIRKNIKNEAPCHVCMVSAFQNQSNATCTELMRKDPERFEKIVADWAEKNPEPRYPTWNEVWEQLFPDSHYAACPGYFLHFDRVEQYCGIPHKCAICRAQPIPADIAEKLSIKPIGGEENSSAQ